MTNEELLVKMILDMNEQMNKRFDHVDAELKHLREDTENLYNILKLHKLDDISTQVVLK